MSHASTLGTRWAVSGLIFVFLFLCPTVWAQNSEDHTGHQMEKMRTGKTNQEPMSPADCNEMSYWNFSTASCEPLPMAGSATKMWMIHGNGFLVQNAAPGPRGRNYFSSPNMIMGNFGSSISERHYFAVSLMATFERWTFPRRGYPELLQIGERDEDDQPYIDGQHPHSSPIMGITFSDTIRLGQGKDHVKIFFAPRGQATDGPIAFMHRPTGMINPDAPLGHHIGQDVSHITSTVVGASLGLGRTRFELSAFNGTEPEPTKVDLPLGPLNSYGARLVYEFSDNWSAMTSAGIVNDPEPHDKDLKRVYRYSFSVYDQHSLDGGLRFHNSFIIGVVNFYDHISLLRSVLDEFWIRSGDRHNFWGRIEFVERTASQLAIAGVVDPRKPQWVGAFTAGYTYNAMKFNQNKLGIGVSVTKSLPSAEFKDAYGGDPLSGKIFIQVSGMTMGEVLN